VRYSWFLCLLVLSTAIVQAVPLPRPPQHNSAAAADDDDDDDDAKSPSATPSSKLPPQTPVITIRGICDRTMSKPPSSPKAAGIAVKMSCETTVTRAKFEALAEDLQPGMPAAKKQQFGAGYSNLLVMAHEARIRGLDKSERVEEMVEFARLQILAEELNRSLQKESSRISSTSVSDYYRKSSAQFEQATLERIFIPRSQQPQPARATSNSESKSPGLETLVSMTQEAEALHARAVAGDEFAKLQMEAFAVAGVKASSPSTSMAPVRRGGLPQAHVGVFDLRPGEISPVISDASGHYIYKMVSKEILPLDQVKDEISSTLQGQHMRELTQRIHGSANIELNDAYFAPPDAETGSRASTSKTPTALDEPRVQH
jgi:hypothetical protein